MEGYCRAHGGEISGGWQQNYGYIVETEHYRYYLRCNPSREIIRRIWPALICGCSG